MSRASTRPRWATHSRASRVCALQTRVPPKPTFSRHSLKYRPSSSSPARKPAAGAHAVCVPADLAALERHLAGDAPFAWTVEFSLVKSDPVVAVATDDVALVGDVIHK